MGFCNGLYRRHNYILKDLRRTFATCQTRVGCPATGWVYTRGDKVPLLLRELGTAGTSCLTFGPSHYGGESPSNNRAPLPQNNQESHGSTRDVQLLPKLYKMVCMDRCSSLRRSQKAIGHC